MQDLTLQHDYCSMIEPGPFSFFAIGLQGNKYELLWRVAAVERQLAGVARRFAVGVP
jgi:hypothetical protein